MLESQTEASSECEEAGAAALGESEQKNGS